MLKTIEERLTEVEKQIETLIRQQCRFEIVQFDLIAQFNNNAETIKKQFQSILKYLNKTH